MASGTSRPRYYQLRGIGELDQYQGAPNPSVAFLIDDFDFQRHGHAGHFVLTSTNGGTARSAKDPLRRNALADMIKVKTRESAPQFEIWLKEPPRTTAPGALAARSAVPLCIAVP